MSEQGKFEVLDDLLVERALHGLPTDRQAELDATLSQVSGLDLSSYDRAAAAVHEGLVSGAIEPMPAALRERLCVDAERFFESPEASGATEATAREPERPAPRRSSASLALWTGWLAAAASVLLWIGGPTSRPGPEPLRGNLLGIEPSDVTALPDALTVAWSSTGDTLSAGAKGEVVWSNSAQAGFMSFENLTRNDSDELQYQLWIFDSDRKHPVDGGVFDVDKDGKVRIEIDPKLLVHSPTLFAITVERPGGVVVSERERIVLTAEVL